MSNKNSSNPMTKADSSRIQSTQATGGNDVGKGSFAARAQSAGDKSSNVNTGSGNQSPGAGQKK